MQELLIPLVTLTFLEIVLGVDNVIFISILSGKLPKEQQKRARRVGLIAAMVMRIGLLWSIFWISRLTEPLFTVPILGQDVSGRDLILLGGGLFLLAKATYEIHDKLEGGHEGGPPRAAASFASVIGQVMILDIVFSLDSVITAIGMADDQRVMIAAVVLAVLVMLVAAEPISRGGRDAPDHQDPRAVVPLADRHVTHGRRARSAHLQGLHLLRDGFLGVRGSDKHPCQAEVHAGCAASLEVREVTVRLVTAVGLAVLSAVALSGQAVVRTERILATASRTFVGLDAVADDVARADVAFLNDETGAPETRRVEMSLLEALVGRRPDVIVAFDVVKRSAQEPLEHFQMGHLSDQEFIAESGLPAAVATAYLPLLKFAAARAWPIVATGPAETGGEDQMSSAIVQAVTIGAAGGKRPLLVSLHARATTSGVSDKAAERVRQQLPGRRVLALRIVAVAHRSSEPAGRRATEHRLRRLHATLGATQRSPFLVRRLVTGPLNAERERNVERGTANRSYNATLCRPECR